MRNRILLVFILLCGYSSLRASHLIGGHITFQAIDSVNYKVYATIYRDCSGVGTGLQDLRVIHGTLDTLITGTLQSSRDVTLSPASCLGGTRCNGGNNAYGFEEKVFLYNVNLSQIQECQIKFQWSECCRIGALTTGGSNMGFVIETTLNKCVSGGFSSMYFPYFVPFINSHARPKVLTFGGLDSTNVFDSISYELVKPFVGIDSLIQYSSGFSEQFPLTYFGAPNNTLPYPTGFHFNNATGNLVFQAQTNNQISTYSVSIKQYKRMGDSMVLLSTIHRNHTTYVLGQPNLTQDAQVIPSYSNFYDINEPDNVCAGDTLEMNTFVRKITGTSTLTADIIQGIIPFDDTSYLWGTYNRFDVNFYPDTTHIRENLYRIIYFFKDDGCTYGSSNWSTVARSIRVYPPINQNTPPVIDRKLSCNGVSLKLRDTFNLYLSDITWNINGEIQKGDSVFYILPDSGVYSYSVSLNNPGNCGYTFYDSFVTTNTNKTAPVIARTTKETCTIDSAYLSVIHPSAYSAWYWDEIDSNHILNLTGDTVQGTKSYHLTYIQDTAHCFFIDTMTFRVNNLPRLTPITAMNHCVGNLINLDINSVIDSAYGIHPLIFSWNWSGIASQSLDTSFYPTIAGKIYRQLEDSIGCLYKDSISINKPAPYTLSVGNDTAVCVGGTVPLKLTSNQPAYSFNRLEWLGYTSGANTSLRADSTHYIVLEAESNKCVQRDSFLLTSGEFMNVNITGDSVLCPGDTNVFLFTGNGVSPYQNVWYYDALVDSNSTDTLIFSGITESGILAIRVEDDNGCISRDTINIHHRLPLLYIQDSLFVCNNTATTIRTDSLKDLNPKNNKWYWQGTLQSIADSVIHTSTSIGRKEKITLLLEDDYGCITEDSVIIHTSPLSTRIDAHPLVCGGDSLMVKAIVNQANYPVNHDWKIGAQNFTDSQFFFVPVPGTSYGMKLIVKDDNQCEASDSFYFVTTNFTLDILADSFLCLADEKTFLPDPRLAQHPVSFEWNFNGNSYLDSLLLLKNSDFNEGWFTLQLKGTDQNNCQAFATAQVYMSKFSHHPFTDNRLCYGDTLVKPSGDTSAFGQVTYLWDNGVQTQSSVNFHFVGNQKGNEKWQYQATDQLGCHIRDSFYIATGNMKSQIIGHTVACDSDTLNFRSLVYNGFAPYHYEWIRNGVLLDTSVDLGITDTLDGKSFLELRITDDVGCISEFSDSIAFRTRPVIISYLEDVYCQNDPLMDLDTLVSPPGGEFLIDGWKPTDILDPENLSTGNYSLFYTAGDSGCWESEIIDFGILAQPQIDFYADTQSGFATFQVRFYALVTANNPKLLWSFGDGSFANDSLSILHAYPDSGWYSVSLGIADSVCANQETKLNYIHVWDSQANSIMLPFEAEINVYPNPFKERLSIVSTVQFDGIEIFDLLGKRNYSNVLPEAKNEIQLDLNFLAAGEYILRLHTASGYTFRKIQKINPAN